MTTRRNFLKSAAVAGVSLPLARSSSLFHTNSSRATLWSPLLEPAEGETLITVLHTNDTHSQIDPIQDNDENYPGKGGVARRATLVKRIQRESEHAVARRRRRDAGHALLQFLQR